MKTHPNGQVSCMRTALMSQRFHWPSVLSNLLEQHNVSTTQHTAASCRLVHTLQTYGHMTADREMRGGPSTCPLSQLPKVPSRHLHCTFHEASTCPSCYLGCQGPPCHPLAWPPNGSCGSPPIPPAAGMRFCGALPRGAQRRPPQQQSSPRRACHLPCMDVYSFMPGQGFLVARSTARCDA